MVSPMVPMGVSTVTGLVAGIHRVGLPVGLVAIRKVDIEQVDLPVQCLHGATIVDGEAGAENAIGFR